MSCDTSRSSVLHPQQTRVKCEKERSCALQRQLCHFLLSKKRRAKGKRSKRASPGRDLTQAPSWQSLIAALYQCDMLGLHPLSSQFSWGLHNAPVTSCKRPTWTFPPMFMEYSAFACACLYMPVWSTADGYQTARHQKRSISHQPQAWLCILPF